MKYSVIAVALCCLAAAWFSGCAAGSATAAYAVRAQTAAALDGAAQQQIVYDAANQARMQILSDLQGAGVITPQQYQSIMQRQQGAAPAAPRQF